MPIVVLRTALSIVKASPCLPAWSSSSFSSSRFSSYISWGNSLKTYSLSWGLGSCKAFYFALVGVSECSGHLSESLAYCGQRLLFIAPLYTSIVRSSKYIVLLALFLAVLLSCTSIFIYGGSLLRSLRGTRMVAASSARLILFGICSIAASSLTDSSMAGQTFGTQIRGETAPIHLPGDMWYFKEPIPHRGCTPVDCGTKIGSLCSPVRCCSEYIYLGRRPVGLV